MNPRSRPSRWAPPESNAQQPAGVAHHGVAGVLGDDRLLAVQAFGGERGQALALALELISSELLHVPPGEHGGVVPAA
jgi:hypothetical protein